MGLGVGSMSYIQQNHDKNEHRMIIKKLKKKLKYVKEKIFKYWDNGACGGT